MKAIHASRQKGEATRARQGRSHALRHCLSARRVLVIAAVVFALGEWNGVVTSTAYAQAQASPPQSQTAPRQGSGQGMRGSGQMMGRGGMMSTAPEQQDARDRGIIGIFPMLSADAVGAPARLIVRGVAPHSPAYYAGIEGGDQIVAVDGQPVSEKSLSDVAKAIRGEVGTPVKLSLNRQGQSREISVTRVEPTSEHDGHHMSRHGHMGGGGMMDMMGH